jgi:hypothetical protein
MKMKPKAIKPAAITPTFPGGAALRPNAAHTEQALDDALKGTFPASDPVPISSGAGQPVKKKKRH